MAAVQIKTAVGAAYFSVTGGGTEASPYIIGLTTSAATGKVQFKTLVGVAYFGVTGSGTIADPFLLCASSS